MWLSAAVACDITTVSWQLWERGAEQGRTVNPRICLNVSSEKPPCLTPDTLMALTSTDLRLTCYSVSLWLRLLLCSYDPFLFCMCIHLKQLSLECCTCVLTVGVTWCDQKVMQCCYQVNSLLGCCQECQTINLCLDHSGTCHVSVLTGPACSRRTLHANITSPQWSDT